MVVGGRRHDPSLCRRSALEPRLPAPRCLCRGRHDLSLPLAVPLPALFPQSCPRHVTQMAQTCSKVTVLRDAGFGEQPDFGVLFAERTGDEAAHESSKAAAS